MGRGSWRGQWAWCPHSVLEVGGSQSERRDCATLLASKMGRGHGPRTAGPVEAGEGERTLFLGPPEGTSPADTLLEPVRPTADIGPPEPMSVVRERKRTKVCFQPLGMWSVPQPETDTGLREQTGSPGPAWPCGPASTAETGCPTCPSPCPSQTCLLFCPFPWVQHPDGVTRELGCPRASGTWGENPKVENSSVSPCG